MAAASAPSDRQGVGFIGLGNMGLGLCLNLAKATAGPVFGYALGYTDAMRAAIAGRGVEWATPEEIAASCEIVFTSLPGPSEVAQVMAGADGVLAAMHEGTIWCDMTTTSCEDARKMQAAAAGCGVVMIEGPVTGGSDGAWAGPGAMGSRGGHAVILAAGPPAVVADNKRVAACLAAMGEVVVCGPKVGDGTAMKLITNGAEYCHSVVLGEALAVAREHGFTLGASVAAIAASSGGSYCASHDGQAVRALDYDPSFPLSLAEKDLACMKKLAVETSVATPMMDKASCTVGRRKSTAATTRG